MIAQNIAFGVMVAVMAYAALRVVTTKNIVHAALYLMVVLATVAGLFLLLGAEFIGITQILIYIGAVTVLFLFGIMLTRRPRSSAESLARSSTGQEGSSLEPGTEFEPEFVPEQLNHKNKLPALLIGTVLAAVSIYAVADYFGGDQLPEESRTTTREVANSIFSQYIIPFEAVSVLLLAALIGAIVVARRE